MRTLDRYIARTFLAACLLIMAVLAVLLSLFELIAQLEDVGRGGYGLGSALLFVLLTLPGRLLDLLPVATLLGGIVALGLLNDRDRESYQRHFYAKHGWTERPTMASFVRPLPGTPDIA